MISQKFLRSFFRKASTLAYKIFLYIGLHQGGGLTFQKEIAEYFHIPLTTLNYHITKFEGEGLLEGGLNLTSEGKTLFKYIWENVGKKRLRAHNIQIIFKVLSCPRYFPDCFSKSIYQLFSNGKYRGIKTVLRDITVMFYSPNKIVCVLRDIYADSDDEITAAVQLLAPEIKNLLEKEFPGVRIDNYEIAKIQKMHVAVLNSVIAETYLLGGSTEENKVFAIDDSHGNKEIELTEPSKALHEIKLLLGLERDFREFLEWRKKK